MKRVFLLDYENTAIRGLYGISELGLGDKVVVFCSNENIKRALYDLLKVYEERSVEIRVHLLKKRAVNALDFMITTYLGFEVSMEEEKEIFVVSADKGYESAIDMAHELSNGIFVGFHESIFDCIHEKYSRSLPQKDDEVFTIDAEETPVIEKQDDRKQLGGKSFKAISGPVEYGHKEEEKEKQQDKYFQFEYKKNIPDKPRSFGPFTLGPRKPKPATKKQRDDYRKAFMERMISEGQIPEQYTNQLSAFMDKCRNKDEFIERAGLALGYKNKELLDIALHYYQEYSKNRP